MSNVAELTTFSQLVKIRKHFHANPELSGEEYKTSKKVAKILTGCKPTSLIENVGGTGVVAIFDSEIPGKTILFRSELDALPIQEVNKFEYRSKVKNVSHKCGHDGHSTILLGLAKLLFKQPPKNGKVVLLFQPAEEIGKGAEAVLTDPRFNAIKPDYVFAFHNLPGYPLNQVVIKKGAFTAAVKSIIIKLEGKTSHAAEPEHGTNPALAIAEILTKTNALSNNQPERKNFAVITPIHIEMGEIAFGISAGYGELRLTFRTWTQKYLEELTEKVVKIIQTVSNKYNLTSQIEWTHYFRANENFNNAVEFIRQAAHENNLTLAERDFPFKWGEDFGLFTQQFKGAMFGIGAGVNCPALHNPDYDFPDEILPVGVQVFHSIISKILK